VFVHGRTAAGLGLSQTLVGRPTLLTAQWSATWSVVDPLIVALPLSAVTAVVVTWLTRPMDRAHVDYVFGGPRPAATRA
jgi:SSS family solute:Na+ symporter